MVAELFRLRPNAVSKMLRTMRSNPEGLAVEAVIKRLRQRLIHVLRETAGNEADVRDTGSEQVFMLQRIRAIYQRLYRSRQEEARRKSAKVENVPPSVAHSHLVLSVLWCGLPLARTTSAPGSYPLFSGLNTLPASTPVNASHTPLPPYTHDSGPVWSTTPSP